MKTSCTKAKRNKQTVYGIHQGKDVRTATAVSSIIQSGTKVSKKTLSVATCMVKDMTTKAITVKGPVVDVKGGDRKSKAAKRKGLGKNLKAQKKA